MDTESYRTFTRQLIASLDGRADVLGLVAVGSMAEQDTRPDAWSDHDFYVITRSGSQALYRNNHQWLPRAQEIVWSFPETAPKTSHRPQGTVSTQQAHLRFV